MTHVGPVVPGGRTRLSPAAVTLALTARKAGIQRQTLAAARCHVLAIIQLHCRKGKREDLVTTRDGSIKKLLKKKNKKVEKKKKYKKKINKKVEKKKLKKN